jgi:uracil-DNA glycosylase family 4
MGFFFNDAKAQASSKPKPKSRLKLADIPVSSLREMGCSVCPHDKNEDLRSPKMKPSGPKDAQLYLLGGSPSKEEDEDNNHWTDKVGDVIYSKFGNAFMKSEVRSNFITQCRGPQTTVEIECCRNRIVADIEAVKPLIIVGIGDEPFYWVTGVEKGGILPHRGSLFVVKVGKHVCYYLPLLYPNFVFKKRSYNKSEFELTMEHDIARVKKLLSTNWLHENPPKFHEGPYDKGVEIITGNEPGDLQRLEAALTKLAKLRESALDVEASGLRPFMQVDPLMLTAAVGDFDHVVAFPLDHPEGWGSNVQRHKAWGLFITYLMNSGKKSCHNLAMEMEWMAYFMDHKVLRITEWDDTMSMAHTFDERPGTKGLGIQTLINFGFDLKKQSHIDVTREKWWLEYALKDILRYNGMDTKWTDALRRVYRPRLAADPVMLAEHERKVRLAPTLVLTEIKGLPVDFKYTKAMNAKLTDDVDSISAKIQRTPEVKDYQRRFGTFSPTNDQHVLKLMKDVLERPEVRVVDQRTEAVSWTTGEDVLSLMPAREVPSAPLILEHRGIAKLLSTYIRPLMDRKIVCPDGFVRCKYGSMVAVTGRLNSEDPNFQNWPKRKHKEVRGCLHARPGEWVAAFDYGQIEFRVVGMASEDPTLVKYCWTGYDVHKYWAERMIKEYGPIKDYIRESWADDFTSARAKAKKEDKDFDEDKLLLKIVRQEAKNGWVFPQLFGSSIRSCAEQLHLPDDVAEDLGAEFWDEFRVVKKWQEGLLKKYEKNLYVETLGGRQRRGPMRKEQIINCPIQGTAADIVTEGMNALSERAMLDDDPDLQPNLNVHDDLTFLLPDATLEQKIPIIVREMCLPRFDYINVPLVVEASVGDRWHTLQEIGVYKSHELFGTRNPYA